MGEKGITNLLDIIEQNAHDCLLRFGIYLKTILIRGCAGGFKDIMFSRLKTVIGKLKSFYRII